MATKDYAKADEQFSRCLAVAPWEAQTLAERGYARLLAGRLDEADADFKLASDSAPRESLLFQQILHNRLLAAQKRNDERAARGFAADEKALKERRKRPANLTCEQHASPSELEPQRPASLQAAIRLMREANAKAGAVSPDEVEFRVVGAADVNPADLERGAAEAGGTLPQSANTLTTEGGSVTMNHILVSKDGQLYLFANMSSGLIYRCGVEGLADLTVAGGGHQPWHIVKDVGVSVPGQRCDPSGENCMSFCPWNSSDIDLVILDARTLKGVSAVRLSFEAGSDQQPEGLLELEWQPNEFVVKGCGAPARYAYGGG